MTQRVCVRINRDFWDADGNRHRKGTEVDVPIEAALDGIETGALSRVKQDAPSAPKAAPKGK